MWLIIYFVLLEVLLLAYTKISKMREIVTLLTFSTNQRKILQRFYPRFLNQDSWHVGTFFHLCWRSSLGFSGSAKYLNHLIVAYIFQVINMIVYFLAEKNIYFQMPTLFIIWGQEVDADPLWEKCVFQLCGAFLMSSFVLVYIPGQIYSNIYIIYIDINWTYCQYSEFIRRNTPCSWIMFGSRGTAIFSIQGLFY